MGSKKLQYLKPWKSCQVDQAAPKIILSHKHSRAKNVISESFRTKISKLFFLKQFKPGKDLV